MSFLVASPQAQVTSLSSRGRPIPEEEWQKWHATIARLYLEDGERLKKVVKTMAEKHNFVVR